MQTDTAHQKYEALKEYLQSLGSVAVAFSSGVDSTFLLKTAQNMLGKNVIAVTARSCTFPKRELDEATAFTKENGIEHIVVESEELEIDGFSKNPANRCYLCKNELFTKIRTVASERNILHIIEGSNIDDNGDYRPGLQAVQELGVLSPLRHVSMTKDEIRLLSNELGLATWNKQSFACLSSRFPYGETITRERLSQIDAAEQFLLDNGFRQVRVRYHGNTARIETDENGFQKFSDRSLRESIYARFKELGFDYTAVDIRGYRTGSMNESLTKTAGLKVL
ncbi:adenine nucleotide alpha hydrolase [Planctomycetales bacterium]|nr:adenine nucleotide alpha hydrolase [Planctomycetales bacterium]